MAGGYLFRYERFGFLDFLLFPSAFFRSDSVRPAEFAETAGDGGSLDVASRKYGNVVRGGFVAYVAVEFVDRLDGLGYREFHIPKGYRVRNTGILCLLFLVSNKKNVKSRILLRRFHCFCDFDVFPGGFAFPVDHQAEVYLADSGALAQELEVSVPVPFGVLGDYLPHGFFHPVFAVKRAFVVVDGSERDTEPFRDFFLVGSGAEGLEDFVPESFLVCHLDR